MSRLKDRPIAALVIVCLLAAACAPAATPTPPRPRTATPTPTQLPAPTPTSSPTPVSSNMYVCRTDGDGVMIRTDAACQSKGPVGMLDNTPVQVLGATGTCARITAPNGTTGYVPLEYLCATAIPPTTGTPTGTPAAITPTGAATGGCPRGCGSPPPGCVIKGNINSDSGDKIYHVPGQRYYQQTVIDPASGELWFCSESEAEANGWRKSKE